MVEIVVQTAEGEACADMRASTTKSAAHSGFDRTGLLTGRCRHSILQFLVPMTSGEKFCYSLAAIHDLLDRGLNVKRIWYDIGDGRYASALRRFPKFIECTCMLPAMHAHMHPLPCRLRWAGLAFEGAGLPNSEASEQENRRLGLVRINGWAARLPYIRQWKANCACWHSRCSRNVPVGPCLDDHVPGSADGHARDVRGAGKRSQGVCGLYC